MNQNEEGFVICNCNGTGPDSLQSRQLHRKNKYTGKSGGCAKDAFYMVQWKVVSDFLSGNTNGKRLRRIRCLK